MPAPLALLSKPQQVSRPRRLADLDLWLKIAVPIFLLASLFIALDSGFFQGYLRLFQRNTYTSLLSALGAVYALAFLTMQANGRRSHRRAGPGPVRGPVPDAVLLCADLSAGCWTSY